MMEEKIQILKGRKPTLEAFDQGVTFEKVFVQQGISKDVFNELRALCKEHTIPLQMLRKDVFNRKYKGNHQGVAALISPISYWEVSNLLPTIYERGDTPCLAFLDRVTDTRNFGAIIRSAEIFGLHGIVSSLKNRALINEDTIKTSAGAIMNLPICREASTISTLESLQENGLKVLASDLRAEKTIQEVDFTEPCILVLGGESNGISREVRQMADETFIIPQLGQSNSLNVSVAAGVIFYEISRQRHQ